MLICNICFCYKVIYELNFCECFAFSLFHASAFYARLRRRLILSQKRNKGWSMESTLDNSGWYFVSCKVCRKKVKSRDEFLRCNNCNKKACFQSQGTQNENVYFLY